MLHPPAEDTYSVKYGSRAETPIESCKGNQESKSLRFRNWNESGKYHRTSSPKDRENYQTHLCFRDKVNLGRAPEITSPVPSSVEASISDENLVPFGLHAPRNAVAENQYLRLIFLYASCEVAVVSC